MRLSFAIKIIYYYQKGSNMRWHQNNIFKPLIAQWKRFIRTDFMTLGYIDIDAEMIQPGRFWIMTEDKNHRRINSDKGDNFQVQIMEERAQASKLPFLGILSENKNEQSPYVFLNQSKVYKIVTNVKSPEKYTDLPIDIVIFKWLDENKLFENDEERLTYIKQYNNNVIRFVRSKERLELCQPTFHNSVRQMIKNWGLNNKVWKEKDFEDTERFDSLFRQIGNILFNSGGNKDDMQRNCLEPTYEQDSGDMKEVLLLKQNGEIVPKEIRTLL